MTEDDDCVLEVDALMSRIAAGAAARGGDAAELSWSSVEDLLVVAEARNAIRRRSPIRVPFLECFVLRALAFVSRDQRSVNLALVAALRASVAANRELANRVRALEGER